MKEWQVVELVFMRIESLFVGYKGSTVALYHTHPLWRHTEKVA